MESAYRDVVERIERVLARHRGFSRTPSRQEIDDLYTDACAVILTVERERAELDRDLTALLADASEEPDVIRRSRDLAQRRAQLEREIDSLRAITDGLATAAEWMRDPASADAARLAESRPI